MMLFIKAGLEVYFMILGNDFDIDRRLPADISIE